MSIYAPTIAVSNETLERLKSAKQQIKGKYETYDAVINRLLDKKK